MAIPVIVSVWFRLQSALSAGIGIILKQYCIFDTGYSYCSELLNLLSNTSGVDRREKLASQFTTQHSHCAQREQENYTCVSDAKAIPLQMFDHFSCILE